VRRLLGWGVLIVGVGGLGYVAPTTYASGIEQTVLRNAQDMARTIDATLDLRVSGRDVFVAGTVKDDATLVHVKSQFADADGVRVVDVSGVSTWPLAEPFGLTATRAVNGTRHVRGVVPTLAALDLGMDVSVAAGVPDDAWLGVVENGIDALDVLNDGTFTIQTREIEVKGTARTPTERAALIQRFDDLPTGYAAVFDIDVQDDGTPLRLDATLRGGVMRAVGKLPAGMSPVDVSNALGADSDVDVALSALPAFDPAWPDAARLGLAALGVLKDGQLNIENHSVVLVGSGDPASIELALNILSEIAPAFAVTQDLSVWDDGRPHTLVMTWDGSTARAEGKYPAAFAPRGPAGVALNDTGEQSFLVDEDGVFAANATAGITALGLLSDGTLRVTDTTVNLIGVAASPRVGDVIDSVLAGLSADISRGIVFLDDGSPASWTLTFDAETGGRIDGRLPNGLTQDAIASVLGVSDLAGTSAIATQDRDLADSPDTLRIVSTYLFQTEALEYTRDETGSVLTLTVSPGVDIDQVAINLAERLPVDVAFSVSLLDPYPAEGATRLNALTGLNEQFRSGFWIPELTFTPDVAGCDFQSRKVFDRAAITFLSSSAQLDATSIGAINGLAAVARPCLDAGLVLEIGQQ